MIFGVGIDIVQIGRIKKAIERYGERFKNRIFTGREQAYCSEKVFTFESYAARFAVKEAAFKALGRGWDECGGFTSIEVINDEHNRPYIIFHGRAEQYIGSINVKHVFVSITHDADISAAVVVIEN